MYLRFFKKIKDIFLNNTKCIKHYLLNLGYKLR